MNKEQILAIIKAIDAPLVGGALGELKNCAAYVEEVKMSEYGYLTKYFGVSYYSKGKTDNDIIDRVTITKRAFFEIFKLMFPFGLIFRRKKLIESLIRIYRAEGGLKSRCLKEKEFCPVCQEIIRVAKREIPKKITLKGCTLFRPRKEVEVNKELTLIDLKDDENDLIHCIAMFLQFSPSFRVRVQDILEKLDKNSFEKSPLTEVLRLKRIFMFREIVEVKKMNFLWWMIFLGVALNKGLARKFVAELDIEKAKLDESDWYLCLRRKSYNFGGISIEKRLEEAEKIDKEKGHIILNI